jgi:hypothetical protein
MTITRHEVRGHAAYSIASSRLAITCLPGRGAHITSLRSGDHEWLWVPAGGPGLHPVAADDDFEPHQEGADDCFPTVHADVVRGVRYPDHGAVWHRPWRVLSADAALELAIDIPAAGLACWRRLAVDGEGLRLDWRIANRTGLPVPYAWAWHPLFRWRPDDRLDLPGTGTVHLRMRGIPGLTPCPWPSPYAGADLSRGMLGERKGLKCFTAATGEAWLHSGGHRLGMRWDPLVLPHAGLWFKHYDGHDHWAIEPTNIRGDSVGSLPRLPPESILPAGAERCWSIRLLSG